MVGHAQHHRDDHCRERDEQRIYQEQVERAQEERGLPGGDTITGGAERRHKRGCDRHAGDNVALFLTGVADGAGDSSEEGDEYVPDGGACPGYHLGGGGIQRSYQKIHRGAYQADNDLRTEAYQRPAEQPQIPYREGISHRHDSAHQRRYQHRADYHRGGVHVQPYGGYQRGQAQYPHVGTVDHRVLQHHLVYFLVAHHSVVHVQHVADELAESAAALFYVLVYRLVYLVGFFSFCAHLVPLCHIIVLH